tara:strand:- start:76 stop:714 length:639 start_codon:yes stop_codon:yes gene_type:complete
METTEDILKEFEEFTSVKIENAHFDMSINEDQFGQKTLNIIHSAKKGKVAMGVFKIVFGSFWLVSFFTKTIIILTGKIIFSLELLPIDFGNSKVLEIYSDILFCFLSFFLGVGSLLLGYKTLKNVEHLNVENDRISFYKKPISFKGKIELLNSEIKKLDVSLSVIRFNNRPSYHLIVFTNTNKSYKLITHNFNKKALEYIQQKIKDKIGFTA